MVVRRSSFLPVWMPGAAFVLLVLLLMVLWLAGGASRADAFGQVVVRACTWAALVGAILLAKPSLHGTRPVLMILSAALLLTALQLVPLPPAVWQTLPGRDVLIPAAVGGEQPWRPLTLTPGATRNALFSLVVPYVTLLLAAQLKPVERSRLPGLLLCVIMAEAFVGLLQFSGAVIENPFVNDTIGEVSGTLANRNHFAVLLATGCPLAVLWALDGLRSRKRWRVPVSFGMIVLFILIILATGSRGGMLAGGLALIGALLLARSGWRQQSRQMPRWMFPAIVAGIVAVIAALVLASIAADRAVAIDRAFAVDVSKDMRSRGLPTVFAMIRAYFPVGSGLGGFDPVFRLHEPFSLLKPTFFNHAHNDYLEVVLDAGAPGLALMVAALAWWGWASLAAWRRSSGADLARAGSIMIGAVAVASAFDYPVRTPIMMAIMVIAGMWLGGFAESGRRSALPGTAEELWPSTSPD